MKGIRSMGLGGLGVIAIWLGPMAGPAHAACGAPPALSRNVLGTATGTAVAGATLEFNATGSGYAAGAGENLVTLSQLFPKGQGSKAITGQVTRRSSGQVGLEWRRIIDNQEKVVAIGVNAAGRLFFALRSNGAAALGVTDGPTVALPIWLKLNRVGGTISGYYSANGADWTLLSSAPDILGNSDDQAYASFTASGNASIGDACLDVAARVPRYPVKSCTTPNPAVAKATFSILSDDMAEVLVNGYYVGETTEHQFLAPMVLDVNPCFLAGGVRLIAVKNYDNQDNMMGVSYELEIRYADGTVKTHTSNASEGVQYVYEGNSSGRGDREPFQPVAKDAAGKSWFDPDFVPDARWKPAVNFPAGCEASLGHIDPSIPWISYPKLPCPAANAGNEIAFRQFYDVPLVIAGVNFTDAAGTPLPPGGFWAPDKGKLHISFTDDFVNPDLAKTFSISIRNRNGAALPDSEAIVVKTHAKRNAATGQWEAVVDLAETRAPVRLNGKAEVYLLGDITVSVPGHDGAGNPDGNRFTATLKAAYPDKPARITIQDADAPAAAVDRFTSRLSIVLEDQDVSSLPNDTLWARVACAAGGDAVARLAMVEKTPGTYVSAPLGKGEGPANAADGLLACASTDKLSVTYADEIYGTTAIASAEWDGSKGGGLRYTLSDTSISVAGVQDGKDGNVFRVIAQGASPTAGIVDKIVLILATDSPQPDTERITLTETSANSGIFLSDAPIRFSFDTPPVHGNGSIEAIRAPAARDAGVVLKGEAILNGVTLTRNLILMPIPIPPIPPNPATAYIKDEDGDGAGDHVYFEFARRLETLPASIGPVYWNTGTAASANPAVPVIAFVAGTDQKRVSADYGKSPFGKGLTGIPADAFPFATLPAGDVFDGQKPALADSMGPVLLKAHLSPSGYSDDPSFISRDTLRVALSETLAPADWTGLLRFGSARDGLCADYPGSTPVPVSGAPSFSADGLAVTVLIDASQIARTPVLGDCVYLGTGPEITDRHGNRPPEMGVRLEGDLAKPLVIMNAYPPIAGKGAVLVPGAGGDYAGWIAPVGFVPGSRYAEAPLPLPGSPGAGPDGSIPTPLPEGIATVQVIANRKYIATVSIFDNLGHSVSRFTQSFGYRGEMGNRERRAGNKGWTGFLVWDLRDRRGRLAGQGVYIWSIALRFEDGTTFVKRIRTGLLR